MAGHPADSAELELRITPRISFNSCFVGPLKIMDHPQQFHMNLCTVRAQVIFVQLESRLRSVGHELRFRGIQNEGKFFIKGSGSVGGAGELRADVLTAGPEAWIIEKDVFCRFQGCRPRHPTRP